MRKIIKFEETRKKKLNIGKIEELSEKMSAIIANAEFSENEEGNIIMDTDSEEKCEELERLIREECLKAGYTMEEMCS